MRLPALALVLLLGSCTGPEVCEEDPRAQLIDEHVEVTIDEHTWLAELADEAVERDRGWRHRFCDREALLLVPDAPPEALPIWGCGLAEPVDAVFIVAGEVAAVERIEPCPEPCSSCTIHGEDLEVDAVLELPVSDRTPSLGSSVALAL